MQMCEIVQDSLQGLGSRSKGVAALGDADIDADRGMKTRECESRKKKPPRLRGLKIRGGEVGIRTLDALVGHTHLAGEHLRPLGHFSTL